MFILINKEKGITSHGVVNVLRKITGEKRIGHAGTLDPNATGLLILGIGRESTKQLDTFLKLDKEYIAEIFLGEERDTDDVEGVIQNSEIRSQNQNAITKENVEVVVKKFIGKQNQTPPIYSAIKIKGKEAYKLARKGQKIELKPRKITVYESEILKYEFPIVSIRYKVSSGTYIRSLARDLGRKLDIGAYLLNLTRTKIGKHSLENAVLLNELTFDNWKKYTFEL